MVRDYTTGKTKFVQILVSAPDGRFAQENIKGGLDKKSAVHEAKQYPKTMIVDLFDSKE